MPFHKRGYIASYRMGSLLPPISSVFGDLRKTESLMQIKCDGTYNSKTLTVANCKFNNFGIVHLCTVSE